MSRPELGNGGEVDCVNGVADGQDDTRGATPCEVGSVVVALADEEERRLITAELQGAFPGARIQELLSDVTPEPADVVVVGGVRGQGPAHAQAVSVAESACRCRPECVVLLLLDPGDGPALSEALQAGVDDYVFRVEGYVSRLPHMVAACWERKLRRRRLDELEERYGELLDRVPVGVFRTTAEGAVREANRVAAEMCGYGSREDFLGADVSRIYVNPSDRPAWVARALHGEPIRGLEVEMCRPDGSTFWASFDIDPARDSEGNITHFYGTMQDVTALREARRGLVRAQGLTKEQRDLALALAATSSTEGALRLCLETAIRVSGLDYGEASVFDEGGLGSNPVVTVGLPPALEAVPAELRFAARIPVVHEGRTVAGLDVGSLTLTAITTVEMEALRAIAAQMGGTLARIKAEESARRRALRYRQLLDNMPDVVYTMNREGRIVAVNAALERILGFAPEEVVGTHFVRLIHPDDRDFALRQFERAMAERRLHTRGLTLRMMTKSRQVRHVELNSDITFDAQGEFVQEEGVFRDISERVAADEDRMLLQSAVEQVTEGILITDSRGRVLYANPAFERLSGVARQDLLGRFPGPVVRGLEDGEKEKAFLKAFWERRGWQGSVRYRTAHGSRLSLRVTLSPVHDRRGASADMVLVVGDATDQERIEEELRQSQKMEAVGRLAGGVAHDFNNMLTAIFGGADELLESLPARDTRREEVEEIRNAAERASALTRQLLAFSRRQVLHPRPVDLNGIIREMQVLLGRLIGEDIHLLSRLGESLGSVMVDPNQIEQVLLNLAVNARDAMPEGGVLAIETTSVTVPEVAEGGFPQDGAAADSAGLAALAGLEPGDYVKLTVSDSGRGMDADTISHLFEPFFTTKEHGEGTGLGLSTVYGIVAQSGGEIVVSSEPGMGTTFEVFLPKTESTADRDARVAVRSETEASGRQEGDLVVVEDEALVRSLMCRVLRRAGFRVHEAAAGLEALEIMRLEGEGIAMVITDAVMPGMSGRTLLCRLREEWPHVALLLVSGYDPELVGAGPLAELGVGFLPKPFSPEELLEAVRTALSRGNRCGEDLRV